MDTDLYERSGKAITNFTSTLPSTQGELAQELTKDPYNFNFLTLDKTTMKKILKMPRHDDENLLYSPDSKLILVPKMYYI